MAFDGACKLKNWGVSWLLLPGISNWKAAELTEHFSSTFLIGLTRVTEVVASAYVKVQAYPYLGTVTILKRSIQFVFSVTTNCSAIVSSTYFAQRLIS